MLNRADNPYRSSHDAPRSSGHRDFDGRPGLRIDILFGGIAAALCTIATRLAFVRTQLSEEYAVEFDRTVEQLEPIPSHDGRIIAAGGEVLAEDQQVFGLKVHYRWLEEPSDPAWLKAQALSRLDRPSRRDPEKSGSRAGTYSRSEISFGRKSRSRRASTPKFSTKRRREIRRRVEHIYDLVKSRRTAQDVDSSAEDSVTDPPRSRPQAFERSFGTRL